MAAEIERKFLVINDDWKKLTPSAVLDLEQGYIPQDERDATRLFIEFNDQAATVKLRNYEDSFNFVAAGGTLPDIKGLGIVDVMDQVHLSGRVQGRIRSEVNEGTGHKVGYITIKRYGGQTQECESEIDYEDALHALDQFCDYVVTKRRVVIPYEGHDWQVDVYGGRAQGLITADVEVAHEDVFKTIRLLPGTGPDVGKVDSLRNWELGRYGVPAEYRLHI